MKEMEWAYCGRRAYADALRRQLHVRDEVRRGARPDTLMLLEHDPVITLGRSANRSNVLASPDVLQRQGISLIEVTRGGDVTYHGPGQLVGYPIRWVGRHVREHATGMAQALIDVLARYNIAATWRDDSPGIWTAEGKIGALGVDARQRVAIHGFALNVSANLNHFSLIVPCGLSEPVTSMDRYLGAATPSVSALASEIAPLMAAQYHVREVEVAEDRLWHSLEAA